MNFKIIIYLSLSGIIIGFASVFGLPRVYEPFCWMVVIFISSGFIVKNTEEKRFLHGFLVNFLNGIWISIIKVMFFSTIIIYNFDFEKNLQYLPEIGLPQYWIFIIGSFTGAIMGLILGLYTFLEGKRIDSERKIA